MSQVSLKFVKNVGDMERTGKADSKIRPSNLAMAKWLTRAFCTLAQ